MAEKNDGGDKTEKPTQKRLSDARKKGQAARSKDLSSTLVMIAWLALGLLLAGWAASRFAALFDQVFRALAHPDAATLAGAAAAAAGVLVTLSLAFLLPVAAVGLLGEFAQVGPIFTFEKMKPKFDHMNPAEGFKRIVDMDNLFEVAKSVLKTVLLTGVVVVVVAGRFRDLSQLAVGDASTAMQALGQTTFELAAATVIAFVFVAVLDAAYQRFSFMRKMRMSRRDIRQEAKDAEGDPHIKAQRRQLHQEWANRNMVEAARGASALVVNPTHIAIALDYDPAQHPAPVVSGKGEGPLAGRMRAAAEDAEVPVMRNVALARALRDRADIEDIVPEDMFAAVAEVIVWAQQERARRREAAEEGAQ